MIIDPVSAVVGGVSLGMNLLQQGAANSARQQDYANQVAFQDATSQFNQWQAGFNSKLSNANAQYKYWAETVQYGQNMAYTSQLRNYELAQEIAQAKRVEQTRTSAGTNYVVNAEALQQRLAEQGMQEAVAMQQYQYRMLQQSAAYQASAQEGRSMDRYVNDFARQMGDYETLTSINQSLQRRQYRRDQLSQVTEYLSQYNSQDFYIAQQYQDPIAPFPPLPALVTPPPPSMTGSAPSSNSSLNIGTAALGGVNAYLTTASAVKQLSAKSPTKP